MALAYYEYRPRNMVLLQPRFEYFMVISYIEVLLYATFILSKTKEAPEIAYFTLIICKHMHRNRFVVQPEFHIMHLP